MDFQYKPIQPGAFIQRITVNFSINECKTEKQVNTANNNISNGTQWWEGLQHPNGEAGEDQRTINQKIKGTHGNVTFTAETMYAVGFSIQDAKGKPISPWGNKPGNLYAVSQPMWISAAKTIPTLKFKAQLIGKTRLSWDCCCSVPWFCFEGYIKDLPQNKGNGKWPPQGGSYKLCSPDKTYDIQSSIYKNNPL